MPEKQFRIPAAQLRPIIQGRGFCFATDEITVAGKRVGYMYRLQPDEPSESGWWFFSGKESPAYLDDPQYTMLYDVNTIANYDPDIVPLLDMHWPAAFKRNWLGRFVKTDLPEE